MHERKPVNLEDIIYDCRSMLFANIDKKGIQFNINILLKGVHHKRRPYQTDAGDPEYPEKQYRGH